MKLAPVPRVLVRHFTPPVLGGAPRIVVGQVARWKALRTWTPAYLKSIAGNTRVMVRETQGAPCNFYQTMGEGGRTTLASYLDWVLETANGRAVQAIAARGGGPADVVRAIRASGIAWSYYLDVKLACLPAHLVADIAAPHWYGRDPIDRIFWCGVLGTSSGLHFDLQPNCNVQLAGNKHFALFPPAMGRALYRIGGTTHCHFDPNLPDFERYPLARHVRGMQCVLQPGESLYIPAGWFHQVTIVSPWATNVNFFWPRPLPQALFTPLLWGQLLLRGRARVHVSLNKLRERLP
ncbi:cupin-like domain-containing protein [Massilia sp. DWR3-1-1]|uniref:cupin-like domain-containing protein n=1 Tax=Massilia sp. DWR3-1-1 TaxID=2804559 RepID=UPI003CF8D624